MIQDICFVCYKYILLHIQFGCYFTLQITPLGKHVQLQQKVRETCNKTYPVADGQAVGMTMLTCIASKTCCPALSIPTKAGCYFTLQITPLGKHVYLQQNLSSC